MLVYACFAREIVLGCIGLSLVVLVMIDFTRCCSCLLLWRMSMKHWDAIEYAGLTWLHKLVVYRCVISLLDVLRNAAKVRAIHGEGMKAVLLTICCACSCEVQKYTQSTQVHK